ncbi:MAG TPA: TadE family protein [Gemmatimonadaceae bacterium]|nr:TadE family protein [Gemmatimonadaceae bacterium]
MRLGRGRFRFLAQSERASAMVEFAIISPLLFVLIFGIIDFGRALFLMNNLTAAVREGARLAAVQADPTTAASKTAVQNRVVAYITNFGGTTPTTLPTVTPNMAGGQVMSVSVTLTGYPFTGITPLIPLTALLSGGTGMSALAMPTISAVFRSETAGS